MAQKISSNTPAAPSYTDFVPNSELKEAEGVDTLIIRLPGFKKEQLKVQVSSLGILRVRGGKPENVEGTIRRRFVKEIKVPEGCDVNEIRAKFINNELHVMMPKKVMTPPQVVQQQQQEAAALSSGTTKSAATQKPKPEAKFPKDQEQKADNLQSTENGKLGTAFSYYDQLKYHTCGLGHTFTRLREIKRLPLQFGVALVAMVTIGAFVAHNCIQEPGLN